MKPPTSTYRIQFSKDFTFEDFKKILDYLQSLGIGSIYASPILEARVGSTHGYDGIDPYRLNPEIGSLEEFRSITDELQDKRISWLQDIVPNHMAYTAYNPWISSIFELGPGSKYYRYFDIDWSGSGKVMAPILGTSLEQVLENGDLKLHFSEKGFSIQYYEHLLPLSANSYGLILDGLDFDGWEGKFKGFSGNQEAWEALKVNFLRELLERPGWLQELHEKRNHWKQLLDLQYFQLVPWQQTEKEINYRRFFTINDLICLRMEEEEVFSEYHYFLKELFESGWIQGFRIDHIDGLFSPSKYLRKLRQNFGKEVYIIVEKILDGQEELPGAWPVQGSTGYDFLGLVNQLFLASDNEAYFTRAFGELAPEIPCFNQLSFEKKRSILREKMGGELENLTQLFLKLKLTELAVGEKENWKEALAMFLASFPVYRMYPESLPLTTEQRQVIMAALEFALHRSKDDLHGLEKEIGVLGKVFLGEAGSGKSNLLEFLQRTQQFTGPLMAKGVEDTAFYLFNRLISQNEVGDSPSRFGISVRNFHQRIPQRQERFPFSLNATATHDTKRGEDARMRLNVLSELPEEWFSKLWEWRELNSELKGEKAIPEANEESMIYQALIGSYPFEKAELPQFWERFAAYLQKALREAKLHTDWSAPNKLYEQGVLDFASRLEQHQAFRKSFDPFFEKIGYYGCIKSLGQSLLKLSIPGVPDIYQGTELWDFSFVDPDNRIPVNYVLCERYLYDIQLVELYNLKETLSSWLRTYQDGKVKMYLLWKGLSLRKKYPSFFEKGDYQTLQVNGQHKEKILAFARCFEDQWMIGVIPLAVTEIFEEKDFEVKELDSEIVFPKGSPRKWKHLYSGTEFAVDERISLKSLLQEFPVGVLTNFS